MKKTIAAVLAGLLGFGVGFTAPAAFAEVFHRFTDKSNVEKGSVSDDSGNPRLIGLELNATDAATGTLPDARLSSNVPLKDAENVYTATSTFRAADAEAASAIFENESSVAVASVTAAGKIVAVEFEGDGSKLTGVTGASHADGGNCSAGNAPLGVDGVGAVQGCFDVETDSEASTHEGNASAHHAATADTNADTICSGTGNYLDGEGNCDPLVTDTGAPHGNGANCSAGESPLGVDAAGAVESCFDVQTGSEQSTHEGNASAHHAKTAVDDTPDNGDTASAPTANWAFDHDADAAAHHTATASGDITHDSTIGGTTDDAHFDHADDLSELNSQLGTSIADGAHTSNTDAESKCAAGEFLEGDGSCTDVIEEAELASLSHLNTQLGTSIADGAHTSSLAAGAITAGSFPSGTFTFQATTILNGIEVRGLAAEASICSATCTGHGASKVCMYISTTSFDIYTSTGATAGQYRNSRTGVGPC